MLKFFMFVPVAIIMALTLGAAASVYVDGGVNQEGFDYDLTCTRDANVHWVDRWMDHEEGHLAGGWYKTGLTVFADEDCEGQSIQVVVTGIKHWDDKDEHQTLWKSEFGSRIDEDGKAIFSIDPKIAVWKVKDVHILIFTDCNFVDPDDDCPQKQD